MIFGGITKRYRHIKRYRKIVKVLIKHGFGYLIEVMELHQFVPLRKRIKKLDSSEDKLGKAIRLRKVLEELGPTFIKLGQLLSTRPDLLPRKYIEELEKLQDQVPAMEFDKIIEQIEEELDASYTEYFSELSSVPLATASIGQVHQGILKSGEKVVIKVRRVGIEQNIETDLEIMSNLASILENKVFSDDFISPIEIVSDFSHMIRKELDYRIEGRNATKFSNNFFQNPDIKIAKVFKKLTTRKILTMEFISGTSIKNIDNESKRTELAKLISKSFMKQILIDGFFHGDPHPGNIMITTDYKFALLDFGLVGQLSREDRERVATLFISMLKKDVNKAVDQLLELGMVTQEINIKSLKRDFYRFIDDYYGATLEEVELGSLINRLLDLAFKYKIKLPTEFILLGKSLITIEGIVSSIDPQFNILTVAEPFIYKIIKKRLHPKRLMQDLVKEIRDVLDPLSDLPAGLKKIISLLADDNLELNLNHIGIKRLISKLDIIANRLSISLIISAVIIGSSLIMLTDKGGTFLGFPIVGISGYLIAVILGIWLIISILRSGRF